MIRIFDLFCSCLGLLVLSPAFLAIAGLIKLSDRGPVFYRQERVGKDGKSFEIIKFRTMCVGADRAGPPLTVAQDRRITRVGAFLRKWKLDELPQLINVIRGEMGLVGPRPEVPRYLAHYSPAQARVLRLRPGITDAASIAYRYENEVLTRTLDPEAFYIQHIMPNKIRINLEYADQATLWTNVKTILATLGILRPPVAVRAPGDLRAFDRIALARPLRLSTKGLASMEVHPVDFSQGGVLLPPGDEDALGGFCTFTFSPDDSGPAPITREGQIIRSDAKGVAFRFSAPLEDDQYKMLKIMARPRGSTKSSGEC